ncbi:Alpha-D-GlcNAc alpha-1,2-L-rhamnosyltransferase [hydrothermal vent metagenome]|uniref:Alpha-D-GlcNAc alpha-1,2-L-rhamnosyltransferase n=1 Tax=hydrothermal vent metagenome TaxID=652676 RepID=A0A3B0ZVF6_9ZZZZ
MAVRFSHDVIADNGAIANYEEESYGIDSHVIAYGGDHAVTIEPVSVLDLIWPKSVTLGT